MEDSFLFSATVGENIAYGRPDATAEQIVAAAQAPRRTIHRQAAKGYDTMVASRPDAVRRATTASGPGPALVTDPRLLLLDDATSAIDARLEAEIHARCAS